MECTKDIKTFSNIRSESKLYQFLASIGDEFDTEKRDMIKDDPKLTLEEAYARIRTKIHQRLVMESENQPSVPISTITSGLGVGLTVNPSRWTTGGCRQSHKQNRSGILHQATLR